MKRYISLIALVVALALYLNNKTEAPPIRNAAQVGAGQGLPDPVQAPAEVAVRTIQDPPEKNEFVVPTFFPKAKVIARVADPVDGRGRQRVIETVETSMKEPYVRVERVFQRTGSGKHGQVGGEMAMVSNQLLLEKPDSLEKDAFETMLRQAGALEVAEMGESYLATFAADPTNPRALDAFMSRVKEVAGADVTVEPNYIRKIF